MRVLAALLCLLPLAVAAQQGTLEISNSPAWMRLHYHFRALSQDPSAPPLRILHLGDSHTAATAFSGRLRRLIEQRFRDSGPGLLPPGEVAGHPLGHLDLRQSDGWVSQRERHPSTPTGGALGGFVAYGSRPDQGLAYRLPRGNRDARLILYTDPESPAQPPRFRVFHDRREIAPLTRSLEGRIFYALPPGNGRVDIVSSQGGRSNRLRGINLLSASAGVSYSALGVNGARFSILQEWQGSTVYMQMADYQPDLLMLAFGTNDVVSGAFSREAFNRTLRMIESWIAAYGRQSAVLMILPPPLPRHDQRVQANLDILREQVRLYARKNGWSVWDWSRALGPNGLDAFYARDGIHLNAAGYAQSAQRLFEALSVTF